MNVPRLIATKRDGGELSDAEIQAFLEGYVAGEIPDYQAAALLMAVFHRGMGARELATFTRAMLESGAVLAFPEVARSKADKHSTGGVGDKVSIPLAPAVAACGVAVPMVSGRGLGHTGGTLDKLEAIPGFRTDVPTEDFARRLDDTGVVLAGQTAELVPADKLLYALRDVTATVESIPLIASSILSKKLAEGIDALVLDVKFGSGAFLREPERGAELARTMVALAGSMGLPTVAYQTSMTRPLGETVGHALEIEESLACLGGGGPADLRELVCLLGGEMLAQVAAAADPDEGSARIAAVLDDGSARALFARVVEQHGGDPRAVDDPVLLPQAPDREVVVAREAGALRYADVRAVGLAVAALGGGRRVKEDVIDPAVGLRVLAPEGGAVEVGQPLFELHHRGGRGLAEARAELDRAVLIGDGSEPAPLVLDRIVPTEDPT